MKISQILALEKDVVVGELTCRIEEIYKRVVPEDNSYSYQNVIVKDDTGKITLQLKNIAEIPFKANDLIRITSTTTKFGLKGARVGIDKKNGSKLLIVTSAAGFESLGKATAPAPRTATNATTEATAPLNTTKIPKEQIVDVDNSWVRISVVSSVSKILQHESYAEQSTPELRETFLAWAIFIENYIANGVEVPELEASMRREQDAQLKAEAQEPETELPGEDCPF